MKPQKTTLKRGLAVGSAVLLGSVTGEAFKYAATSPSIRIPNDIFSTSAPKFPIGKTEAALAPLNISIPPDNDTWSTSDRRRFKELAKKRAALEATFEENREFAELERRRRLYESKTSGEEVLNEWRRRRFVTKLVDLLSCNVSFFKPEDQARIRTFGQTSRP
jgi:hypothetical protein